ncbi:MAG: integrase [Castellaniella sp.]|uniref:DDE-type integrase/transposase/recombinase n=1 Tax=Castellaniella sp. TaxID=1955812 RepID=UPI0012183483|nr:DDE-type integrase/transposase/recombinase [Castellaniella sp.]TAN30323.1 MAG: integrase [Castellaniella sp.]
MLTPVEMDSLFDRLGTPEKGRKLVRDARQQAPVREVKSRGTNIITYFASRKMGCEIATESRQAEYAAALNYEYDPQLLEYYPQPCRLKLDLFDESNDQVHPIDHTPDFLVIRKDQITLQEWKTEDKLMSLARRHPWRYEKQGSQWRSPQIEAYCADLGIGYELHSSAAVHPNRTKNLEILSDYFDPRTPSCSPKVLAGLRAALEEHGRLSIRDLHGLGFQADEINTAVAHGHLMCDLDSALLSAPDNFLVYRDHELMVFHRDRLMEGRPQPEGSFAFPLVQGASFSYSGTIFTIELLTADGVVCNIPGQNRTTTLNKDWLLNTHASGKLTVLSSPSTNEIDISPLLCRSESELKKARQRARALDEGYDPRRTPFSDRTFRRLKAQQSLAVINNENEILSLAPRHGDKGNRKPRLSEEQIGAMEFIRKTFYVTSRAPTAKAAHQELQAHCQNKSIGCPSYPTFVNYLKANESNASRRARYGKRLAYQQAPFYYSLSYDTPRHGVRPFECVHMDHTLLDIELRAQKTGTPLGRPWLSLAVDAYSRRIMAMCLSFMPPDRRAVFMCLRDFVRRWNRVPQTLMTDNGKDLISHDVRSFLGYMGTNLRLRPAGQPRTGAVMERMFGTLNTQLIHNLDGNTKLTRNVRSLTGTHLPQRLATWGLEHLYHVLEDWAFNIYDQTPHPTLDMSPRDAFERALQETGERAHHMIAYNRDLLILTCPSVDQGGLRTIDRQRGVKVNNFYYQSPYFDSLLLTSRKVPVRFDPENVGRVFVQKPDRTWIDAHCMLLRDLPRMDERQLAAVSAEYQKTHSKKFRQAAPPYPFIGTATRLREFICTMSLSEDSRRQMEKMEETSRLHQELGLLLEQRDDQTKTFGLDTLQQYARDQASGHDSIRKKSLRKVLIGHKEQKTAANAAAYQTDLYGDLD